VLALDIFSSPHGTFGLSKELLRKRAIVMPFLKKAKFPAYNKQRQANIRIQGVIVTLLDFISNVVVLEKYGYSPSSLFYVSYFRVCRECVTGALGDGI
jgi:hypothetical protein